MFDPRALSVLRCRLRRLALLSLGAAGSPERRAAILAGAGLDEVGWSELLAAWAAFLARHPEAHALYAAEYRVALRAERAHGPRAVVHAQSGVHDVLAATVASRAVEWPKLAG